MSTLVLEKKDIPTIMSLVERYRLPKSGVRYKLEWFEKYRRRGLFVRPLEGEFTQIILGGYPLMEGQ